MKITIGKPAAIVTNPKNTYRVVIEQTSGDCDATEYESFNFKEQSEFLEMLEVCKAIQGAQDGSGLDSEKLLRRITDNDPELVRRVLSKEKYPEDLLMGICGTDSTVDHQFLASVVSTLPHSLTMMELSMKSWLRNAKQKLDFTYLYDSMEKL